MKRSQFRAKPDADQTTLPLPKRRKCVICKTHFPQFRSMVTWCSAECAITLAGQRLAKKERAEDLVRKEALKRRADWLSEAQISFNAFIRARDAGQPCICCGKPFEPQKPGGSIDAGHYRSRGSAPHLRFDERNCHAQRKNCNRPGGTTHAAFRNGMAQRIGLAALEALEADQESRDLSVESLKAIKELYRNKLKELKARE